MKRNKKLQALRESVLKRHERWKADGKKITHYKCKHCLNSVPTEQPNKSDTGSKWYWDSCQLCIDCWEYNFVGVKPTGETFSDKMEVYGNEYTK